MQFHSSTRLVCYTKLAEKQDGTFTITTTFYSSKNNIQVPSVQIFQWRKKGESFSVCIHAHAPTDTPLCYYWWWQSTHVTSHVPAIYKSKVYEFARMKLYLRTIRWYLFWVLKHTYSFFSVFLYFLDYFWSAHLLCLTPKSGRWIADKASTYSKRQR